MRAGRGIMAAAAAALCLAQAGCSSWDSAMGTLGSGLGPAIPPLIGAGAGYAGYLGSDGDPWWTAGAAAGGYLLAEYVAQRVKRGYEEEYAKGFELGKSNEVKKLYWRIQDMQKGSEVKPQSRTRYYTFPGAQEGPDGTRYVEHGVTVRMEE